MGFVEGWDIEFSPCLFIQESCFRGNIYLVIIEKMKIVMPGRYVDELMLLKPKSKFFFLILQMNNLRTMNAFENLVDAKSSLD